MCCMLQVRRRGQADEAGLREGDVLLTVNGKTCRGLSCGQAMDLIESAGQNVTVRVSRSAFIISALRHGVGALAATARDLGEEGGGVPFPAY